MLFWPRLHIITHIRSCALCVLLSIQILGGCQSASRNIAKAASNTSAVASSSLDKFNEISSLAQASSARFEGHADQDGLSEQATIIGLAETGADEQQSIIQSADDIHSALPGVEDQKSAFERILGNITIIIVVIGVAIILWQTGLGLLLKRVFWGLGLLIPKRKVMEASLDRKILEESDPASIRESIAAKRSADPAYNAAYKRTGTNT